MTIFAWDLDETEPDGEQFDGELWHAYVDGCPSLDPSLEQREPCRDCGDTVDIGGGQRYEETQRGALLCEVCAEERRFRAAIDA
jgi:hypothetical protein